MFKIINNGQHGIIKHVPLLFDRQERVSQAAIRDFDSLCPTEFSKLQYLCPKYSDVGASSYSKLQYLCPMYSDVGASSYSKLQYLCPSYSDVGASSYSKF